MIFANVKLRTFSKHIFKSPSFVCLFVCLFVCCFLCLFVFYLETKPVLQIKNTYRCECNAYTLLEYWILQEFGERWMLYVCANVQPMALLYVSHTNITMPLFPGSPECEHRCVHPVSRRANGLPAVMQPSEVHDSTGSTVSTFLPQQDLDLPKEEFFTPPLASIPEEGPSPQ